MPGRLVTYQLVLVRLLGIRPYSRRRLRLWSQGILGLGVAVALAGAVLTYWYVEQVRASAAAPAATVGVVVATRDIPARTRLAPGDLRVAALPVGSAPSGAFASVDQIAGRVTAIPLVANEPLLPGKVITAVTGDFSLLGAGERVTPSMADYRALSISVPDASAVAGALKAGDVVDILVAGRLGKDPLADIASRIAFTKVEILARNQTIYTIRVDASDAEKIAYLEASGATLRFLLRAPGDERAPRATGADSTVVAPLLRVGGASR